MKSRHSNSLVLVWRVAEFEARHLNAPAIEPEHLLLGLCKVVDLELTELVPKDLPNRDEVLEEVLREVRKLRAIFRDAGLDARIFRRRLRRAAPERRFSVAESERLRRSPAARQVFAEAERCAQLGGATVFPVHLLFATLLAEDPHRDATLAEIKVDKEQLVSLARSAVLTPQPDSASASEKARTRWN